MAVRGVFATAGSAFGLLTDGLLGWWPLAERPVEIGSVPGRELRWRLAGGQVLVELTATTPVSTRVRVEQSGGDPVDWDTVLAAFTAVAGQPEVHAAFGKLLNNETWVRIGDREELTGADADAAIRVAYAQAYHWYAAGGPTEHQRAEWLLAYVHVLAGVPERATHHAERCWALTERHDMDGFDRAYALLAMARCAAMADDPATALRRRAEAMAVPIKDPTDADIFRADADAGPWFGLGSA